MPRDAGTRKEKGREGVSQSERVRRRERTYVVRGDEQLGERESRLSLDVFTTRDRVSRDKRSDGIYVKYHI